MEQIGQSLDTCPTLPTPWNMDDMDEFLAEMIRWIAKEPEEVGRFGWAKDGSSLLDIACETLVNFHKKSEECEHESEEIKLEGVLGVLEYARIKYDEIGSVCEEDEEALEQIWRRVFGLEKKEQGMEGHRELEVTGSEAEEKERQDPKEKDEREDLEEDDALDELEEDDALDEHLDGHRKLEEMGREAEEGEEPEGNEDPEVGGERENQVRQDPEEKLLNGQDEGFKEDDGERGEGAKIWPTRQWWDLFFYDSEVDGDEGFEDDEEEEREQPRVEDERGERRGRGRTKLESLHKDWETWDEKGLSRGDTKRPWRFDEGGEDLLTRGGGSVGEIKLDCREARAERDSNMQVGRSAPEERGEDLRSGANKKMKKEIKTEA